MQEISYMQECLDLIIGAGATWAGGGRGPPPSPLQETHASLTQEATRATQKTDATRVIQRR